MYLGSRLGVGRLPNPTQGLSIYKYESADFACVVQRGAVLLFPLTLPLDHHRLLPEKVNEQYRVNEKKTTWRNN